MKLEPVTASVVVLANGHNPSLLHPEFLEGRNIVPTTWVRNDDIVCTHPVSVVKYNGEDFILLVDNAKLQMTDNVPGEHPENSPGFGVASNYIAALPHVSYTAIGLNFVEFVADPDSNRSILNRFPKNDDSWQKTFPPKAMGIKLVFDIPEGVLTLSTECGNVVKANTAARTGTLVQANCHFTLIGREVAERLAHAQKILTNYADNYRMAKAYITAMIGLGA